MEEGEEEQGEDEEEEGEAQDRQRDDEGRLTAESSQRLECNTILARNDNKWARRLIRLLSQCLSGHWMM